MYYLNVINLCCKNVATNRRYYFSSLKWNKLSEIKYLANLKSLSPTETKHLRHDFIRNSSLDTRRSKYKFYNLLITESSLATESRILSKT